MKTEQEQLAVQAQGHGPGYQERHVIKGYGKGGPPGYDLLDDRIYKVKGLGLVGGSMDITMGQVHQTRKR